MTVLVDKIEFGELLPTFYSLNQNYPNPFNAHTVIEYGLPEKARVAVKIYNVLGQTVRTLVDTEQARGYHRVVWDGKYSSGESVASGVYFYRIEPEHFKKSKKMVLLK